MDGISLSLYISSVFFFKCALSFSDENQGKSLHFSFRKFIYLLVRNFPLCLYIHLKNILTGRPRKIREGRMLRTLLCLQLCVRSMTGSGNQKIQCPPMPQLASYCKFLPSSRLFLPFLGHNLSLTISCLSRPVFLRFKRACNAPGTLVKMQVPIQLFQGRA